MSAVTRTITASALAAAICFTTVNAASPPAPLSCGRGFNVPITIYNQSYMTGRALETIVETARTLWQPYGVTLAPVPEHGLVVVVTQGSTDSTGSGPSRQVLGTTMFTAGHAAPYIRLWVGAAEALIDAGGTTHMWNMPMIERDSRVVPMLGVALAHELGHYLLDTTRHTPGGMLQSVIPFRDLQHPTAERLGLTVGQQDELCSAQGARHAFDARKEKNAPGLPE
jgi:hypothetical protein